MAGVRFFILFPVVVAWVFWVKVSLSFGVFREVNEPVFMTALGRTPLFALTPLQQCNESLAFHERSLPQHHAATHF